MSERAGACLPGLSSTWTRFLRPLTMRAEVSSRNNRRAVKAIDEFSGNATVLIQGRLMGGFELLDVGIGVQPKVAAAPHSPATPSTASATTSPSQAAPSTAATGSPAPGAATSPPPGATTSGATPAPASTGPAKAVSSRSVAGSLDPGSELARKSRP